MFGDSFLSILLAVFLCYKMYQHREKLKQLTFRMWMFLIMLYGSMIALATSIVLFSGKWIKQLPIADWLNVGLRVMMVIVVLSVVSYMLEKLRARIVGKMFD